jgi:hypothetical protein
MFSWPWEMLDSIGSGLISAAFDRMFAPGSVSPALSQATRQQAINRGYGETGIDSIPDHCELQYWLLHGVLGG